MRRAPVVRDRRLMRVCLWIPNCCSSAPRLVKALTAKSTKEGLSLSLSLFSALMVLLWMDDSYIKKKRCQVW